MTTPPLRFRYRTRRSTLICVGLFFACCAGILTYQALTNQTGTTIKGIPLDPANARLLYWMLAFASLLLTSPAAVQFWVSHGMEGEIEFRDDVLSIPAQFGQPAYTIPYTTITSLQITTMSHRRLLTVETSNQTAYLPESMFRSRAEFMDCYEAFVAAWKNAKRAEHALR